MVPVPQLRASMVLVMGTGDPTAPYAEAWLTRRGLSGRILKRRAVKHGELPGEDIVAGAEMVVADWAAANGITGTGINGNGITATGSLAIPSIEELPMAPGDLPVTRKAWARPGCRPVTLYRIDGGGHGWPGGPQFIAGPVRSARSRSTWMRPACCSTWPSGKRPSPSATPSSTGASISASAESSFDGARQANVRSGSPSGALTWRVADGVLSARLQCKLSLTWRVGRGSDPRQRPFRGWREIPSRRAAR